MCVQAQRRAVSVAAYLNTNRRCNTVDMHSRPSALRQLLKIFVVLYQL
jgi:hypothetical protein